ncbi:MAG: class I SAM-dependent methyltransferase [Pseudomonadota bacterium]|nr:class I SAM-dependent methyltransferase [Pseudomonadota bacterium]
MTTLLAAERYLAGPFHRVRGASSKIGAIVATRVAGAQSAHGLRGGLAEIGVFEGRFFIALALCAQPGEKLIATDVFTWPDEAVAERFLANCKANGVDPENVTLQKTATQHLTPDGYRKSVGGPLRFLHIDGAHKYDSVLHDLQLAKAALHPQGVICLDDVLHPLYPALTIAAGDWLKANPEFALLAVVDRESFAASCKFLLCRREHVDFYREALAASSPEILYKHRASYFGDEALIFAAPA